MPIYLIIVDDEELIREGLAGLPWPKIGVQVVGTAENGESALILARELRPDIIISDIRMPHGDGLGLAAAVQKELPNCAMIFLTGHDEFNYAQKAISYGVREYLLKPVDEDKLLESVSALGEKIRQRKILSGENEIPKMNGSDIIKKVKEIVNEHYAGDATLQSVAAQVYLSPSYLSVLFSKEMNMTFKDYLIHTRIKNAKEMLENTDLKILEIAKRVGYDDARYFSDLFKQYTGKTPSQLRTERGYN